MHAQGEDVHIDQGHGVQRKVCIHDIHAVLVVHVVIGARGAPGVRVAVVVSGVHRVPAVGAVLVALPWWRW